MQLLSSTNQLTAIGNNASSFIESQLLQLIGSSIIDCPSLPALNHYFADGVPRLVDLCLKVLCNHIDLIDEVGDLPYFVLKGVLDRCTPVQLMRIESHNPVSCLHLPCCVLNKKHDTFHPSTFIHVTFIRLFSTLSMILINCGKVSARRSSSCLWVTNLRRRVGASITL